MTWRLARRLLAAALAGAFGFGLFGAAHAAEEVTVEAFATWNGKGTLVPMGPNPAIMVATLEGAVYIQTDKGPLLSGTIICPVVAQVQPLDGKLTGRGQCAWTTKEGGQVFAEWTCKGRRLIGCRGDYTMTGGTGNFEGVTGGGPVLLRSELGQIFADATGQAVERVTEGILFWPKLTYRIP